MYFPVSGIEVHPLIPPAVAFVISFFTSMGGVSGAFLLLPFQVSILGFNSPAVSSTNQLFNIVAIPSGVYRYIKEGRMVWPLTWVVIIGTLPGVLIGAVLRIQYLPNPKNFKVFAGLVLLYIGSRLLKDLLTRKKTNQLKPSAEEEFQKLVKEYKLNHENKELPKVVVKKFNLLRISYEFYGQNFDINVIGILALSFIVGIVGGIYGIGGGAIIAPFFVTIFGLPVYTVAGAALMGTFVTSVAGVAFYQIIAPFYPEMSIAPDWILGLLFGIGGAGGMYCGARLQKFMPAKTIKWILAGCILFTASKYIIGFFLKAA
ncbi:MAG: sulfite exporter TauE/SafE family protein [Desulfobulbaceae bacterium]|nr:sulfite exporter TauE/SafE family protein [Desulfobulbaceae bacterium]MCK5436403.1 sulfite exporter TauE/SafE family protein [Desulfobulbaceae bacterium]MCK5543969.1 sulfite exporter TauE/SafE family protein [Desulfobulbaceae bacterium]